jgi:AAA domain, putative AbiEii toxin, Type IV TA system
MSLGPMTTIAGQISASPAARCNTLNLASGLSCRLARYARYLHAMRVVDIQASELFSFDELSLEGLPRRALVVVGPNGAGKTNMSRLVEIVIAAVERSATFSTESYARLVQFASGRRLEAGAGRASGVHLGIACTEGWESDLVVRFVRAVLFTNLLRDTASNFDRARVRQWVDRIEAGDLVPFTAGHIVAELTDPATAQWSLGYEFDVDGERFRLILEASSSSGALVHAEDALRSVPIFFFTDALEPDENRVPAKPFSLSDILPPVGEGRAFIIEPGLVEGEEPIRAWAAAAGVPTDELQRRNYSMSWVLRVLLERGVSLLGDLRMPPQVTYSVDEAGFDPAPADGSRVPLGLFRLKNGGSSDRLRFASIQALFGRLTGREFDVELAQDALARGDAPAGLRISPVVIRSGQDLSMEFAGAGMWEALLLSATLSDAAGRVVVLDEPARNLHPTLQRRLLEEVRGADGQFIVTTHSPYLVPINSEADSAICRLALTGGVTRAHVLRAPSGDGRLQKALGESADARALLFAHGVVLVEGGTELGALPEWFAKSQTGQRRGTPDVRNIVVFSVDGDTGFGTFVRYLHGLGVPWVVVCDGAIFKFGVGKLQIFQQILNAGVHADELRGIVDGVTDELSFEDVRHAGARHGVFTVAGTWDPTGEAFESFLETAVPGQLSAAANVVGKSKPRQGRHVANVTDCPAEIDTLYGEILDQLDPL